MTIQGLIAKGESDVLEFKASFGDAPTATTV
jgi:hypothetical protein